MRLRLLLVLSAPLLLSACGGAAQSTPAPVTETVVSTVTTTSVVTSTETVTAEPPVPEPAPEPAPVEANVNTVPQGFASLPEPAPAASGPFRNCAAARAAGAAPVYAGQPGYGSHLDRDGDGVGCE
ncbi:excalibur calcium-binding domain-containing protein [Corynebacterium nasicanis]|uniref:Excalibur calcium-binding domain-containing protein n=1 Tax=Corynebacterium nasicanis TaxID=1448267 RepID=A0ABW1QAT3_9CORY